MDPILTTITPDEDTNLSAGGDLGRNDIHQTSPLHTLKTLKGFRVVHLNIASLPSILMN